MGNLRLMPAQCCDCCRYLDYETDTSHTITVKATSTDGQDNTQTFTINVSDVTTEGPSIANQVVAFNEGIAATEIINFADASGGDTDGDGDALTYSITAETAVESLRLPVAPVWSRLPAARRWSMPPRRCIH